MATPSPPPEPSVELVPQPVPPAPAPPTPTGRVCTYCGVPVGDDHGGVSWQRRLTPDELAAHVATEQAKRDERIRLADPQLPPPVFPPLPTGENDTRLLLACVDHAIDKEAASQIHQAACTAPNETGRWGCDCTPEPLPEPAPDAGQEEQRFASRLPAHWTTGGD